MMRLEDRVGASPVLRVSSAMGEAIENNDWSGNSLGTMENWPLSLRTALGICLGLPVPCCIVWGERRYQLYNDAYAQLVLVDQARALGVDFAHSWAQAWPTMHACFERAARGEPARLENQQVTFVREAGNEATVRALSFVPIPDESGVGGVMVTLLEPGSAELSEELRRTKAALEQHAHVVSHDFRAPLRMLEQMSRILVTDHAEHLQPRATGLLNHIATGAAKLALRAEMLGRFDVLSQYPLHRQVVDVGAMTSKIIAELRTASADRQVEVIVEELPPAQADCELMRLVWHELLANAFKFTRPVEHSRIEVSGRQQGHHIVYCVKDNGVGFDPKYARRLFGFFQRMHTEDEFEGLGMGLATVKRLIERHGGTVWVEAGKGRGAEFRFTLPA